ncbi:hypothetical protein EAH86_15855 [Pedococcus bigeumensis]|uniref:DUF362 domain-containing protein n=1 Tax=Pedococcus bigeumensis TaxID=433644 RepID=A0A502CQP5_9MICO|nr:hypothetical protein EAH86_15855 [Pedococcus bigeumensis]
MPSRDPLACVVVRGGDVAALGPAIARLGASWDSQAVVLARLSQPTPVSAPVVHALVDLLHDAGCAPVSVGSTLHSYDRDRGHLSVTDLARRAGLLGRTPRGRSYDVVDLGVELLDAPVPEASVLSGQQVSRLWAAAGVRVVVGRAVTDLVHGYAACLATLLGAAPEVAGANPADVAADLLAHLPPALAVVDALSASVGPDGGRLPQPIDSRALVVATDALAADSACAALLGVDRSASLLVERSLRALGAPSGRTEGRLSTLEGAHSAHPLARSAARSLAAEPRLARVLSAATGGPDDGAQPADPVLSTVRALLTPLVVAADDPAGHLPLTTVLGGVASLRQGTVAWATGADKATVDRREVPLGFDPAAYPDAEFDGLPEFFAPFDELLAGLPVGLPDGLPDGLSDTGDGMRWRLVDGATVFEVSRHIRADFDAFVARVDVGAGISLMADYLGGRRVILADQSGGSTTTDGPGESGKDAVTRTRQAERNLYLPQPNYLAAWGGEPIDVCKIELVERGADWHRLTWRTVSSPNGSAEFDDGSLTFTRTDSWTRAVVRGRQLFALPTAWAGIDLAALPELRNPLLEEAYRRFFTTTFDNLEACFEGREFRIGRPPMDPTEPLLTQSLDLLLGAVTQGLGDPPESAARRSGDSAVDSAVDAHGFRHVRGAR